MKIKKGDNVKIVTGADRGKTGIIMRVFPKLQKVIIEGINLRKKHQRPRKEGQQGQIINISHPIHVSNVALTQDKTKKKV